ncbi:hypothetical protein [Halorientalis halophila]|uniref:hypothetical protein n=1 Tax=Halorientalis halophila TaxID=3108499 RepID=UPI00300BF8BF
MGGIAGSIGTQMDVLEEYGTEAFDADEEVRGNALAGSGHPADPTLYNGEPRSAYSYSGDSRAVFRQWRANEITTEEFKRRTPSGEGTAALSLGGDSAGLPTDALDVDPMVLGVSAAAALALAYGVNR